jgi:hypothetical protein
MSQLILCYLATDKEFQGFLPVAGKLFSSGLRLYKCLII